MASKQFFEAACVLKYETEKAILVFDGKLECWLPKSQISYEAEKGGEALVGSAIVVTAPEWLLRDKGMI